MEILKCNGIEKVFGKGENQVTALLLVLILVPDTLTLNDIRMHGTL